MLKHSLLILSLVFLISGCSGDSYEKYIGLWEYKKEGERHQVVEITRNGETILLNYNVLRKSNNPVVLKKNEGQLSYGDQPLGLSENKNILMFSDRSYKIINSTQLTEIKSTIEKNKKLCHSLTSEYEDKKDAVTETIKNDWRARNKKITELKKEYTPKLKNIPNCISWLI